MHITRETTARWCKTMPQRLFVPSLNGSLTVTWEKCYLCGDETDTTTSINWHVLHKQQVFSAWDQYWWEAYNTSDQFSLPIMQSLEVSGSTCQNVRIRFTDNWLWLKGPPSWDLRNPGNDATVGKLVKEALFSPAHFILVPTLPEWRRCFFSSSWVCLTEVRTASTASV